MTKKKSQKKLEEEKKLHKIRIGITIGGIVIVLAAIITGIVVSSAETAKEAEKVYSISVINAEEECDGKIPLNTCKGTITIPATLSDTGKIKDTSIIVSGTEGGTLEGVSEYSGTNRIEISGKIIPQDEYIELTETNTYDGGTRVVVQKSKSTGEERTRYSLKIVYSLSDADKKVLETLEQKRQEKIAEEQRQKAAAEAEAARKKLANTPFTYTSSKCGFQGDVYCLLVSDFVVDDLWKDRVRATFNDFIDKTSAVTSTRHLIYIFKDPSCYNEKINSKGLSVCDVAGGEIAVSQDTDGITWSYEE